MKVSGYEGPTRYFLVRFFNWDSGGIDTANGAFSWTRREINADAFFTRNDTNDEEEAYLSGDAIAEHLYLTRESGGGLFNYGIGPVTSWTTFDPVTNYCDSITYETGTHKVSFVNPTGDLLTGLLQLKVGDSVSIDYTGNGDGTSQTVVTPYNSKTHSFTLDWSSGETVNPTFIVMNVTLPDRLEGNYDGDRSPKNTLWNWEGWDNLHNLKSRQFSLFGDLVYAEGWYGKQIVGREFIMWDTYADEYYAIQFTRWNNQSNYNYPGFSYIRRKIDKEKLAHGLKFEDGTTQRTAYTTKVGGTIPPAPAITSKNLDMTRYINQDDIGKLIIVDGDTPNSVTIPDTSTLHWPVGGVVTILNMSGNTLYIYKDNDDESGTIYGNGTGNSSTGWQVPDTGGYNLVTLMKIKQGMDNYFNDYILSGVGIQVD